LVQKGQEEEGGGESEVGSGTERDGFDSEAVIVQEEKKCGGIGDGAGDVPGSLVAQESEDGGRESEKDRQQRQVAQSQTRDCVNTGICPVIFVFPGVDEEAVEAAEGSEEEGVGEQGYAEVGSSGDGGYEGGGGEEEADGDLLGKAVSDLLPGCSVWCGVDEHEVTDDEGCEDEIEVDGLGVEVRKDDRERDGAEEYSSEEGGAIAVVEEVTSLQPFVAGGIDVQYASVHEAIGSVEHPDGDGHGDGG
jgi:hypothetical protein